MKEKTRDKWICVLFCGVLGLVLLLFLLLPHRSFSEKEKRYLAKAPQLQSSSVLSGAFSREVETWAADHLPGRDWLVGLNAWYDWASGRQGSKDIYRGKSGRLYEAPAPADQEQIRRNTAAICAFAQSLDRSVDLMLVPSAGYVLQEDMPPLTDPYQDNLLLQAVEDSVEGFAEPLDLLACFCSEADPEALYYGTDHHWTARGAWLAASRYLESKGRQTLPSAAYQVTATEGFYGTTYSRSALWGGGGDRIELWDSGGRFRVTNAEASGDHQGLFYREHLTESDKYPVYLDGNHSLLRIHNERGSGKLLLVRDSFASCMACFLADSYEELVLVDLRYYRGAVSQLVRDEGFDDLLILYGLNNFMSDGNLIRLE